MDWERFKNDENFSEDLVFLYESWLSVCRDVKDGVLGVDIINIRVVLKDLINEFELNNFSSNNNRKIYIKLIEKNISLFYLSEFKNELIMLKESLERKKTRRAYVIAKELSNTLKVEDFSIILYEEILKIIIQKHQNKNSRLKIKELVHELILNMITYGREVKDISNYLSNALATYILEEDFFFTDFEFIPVDIQSNQNQVIEYLDSLSVLDRLSLVKNKLKVDIQDYELIFPLRNVRIFQGIETEILGCHIYNPEYLENEEKDDEAFFSSPFFFKDNLVEDKRKCNNHSRCNVLITVESYSIRSAFSVAKKKLELIIDFINLNFSRKFKRAIWDGQYRGRSKDTEQIMSSTPRYVDKFDVFEDIVLTDTELSQLISFSNIITNLMNRDMYFEVNTIKRATKLIAKSQNLPSEDKLLNSWIVLESLADISKVENESKIDFIRNAISNTFFLGERYLPLHRLFYSIEDYAALSDSSNEFEKIPHEILKEIQLYDINRTNGKGVSLKNLYLKLHKLKEFHIPNYLSDEILDVIEFYENNKNALKKMKDKKENLELTIDYIYKCRNQIVHNGYADENLIPHLSNNAESYAVSLYNIILTYFNSNYDLQEYFIQEEVKSSYLEQKLKNNEHYELAIFDNNKKVFEK